MVATHVIGRVDSTSASVSVPPTAIEQGTVRRHTVIRERARIVPKSRRWCIDTVVSISTPEPLRSDPVYRGIGHGVTGDIDRDVGEAVLGCARRDRGDRNRAYVVAVLYLVVPDQPPVLVEVHRIELWRRLRVGARKRDIVNVVDRVLNQRRADRRIIPGQAIGPVHVDRDRVVVRVRVHGRRIASLVRIHPADRRVGEVEIQGLPSRTRGNREARRRPWSRRWELIDQKAAGAQRYPPLAPTSGQPSPCRQQHRRSCRPSHHQTD